MHRKIKNDAPLRMTTNSDAESGVVVAIIFVVAIGLFLVLAMKNDFHFIIY